MRLPCPPFGIALTALALLPALPSAADAAKTGALEFRHPRLSVAENATPLDPTAGGGAPLVLSEPLVPGTGDGNALSWAGIGISGEPTAAQIEEAAWSALAAYLERNPALRVDPAELGAPRVTVYEDGQLVQVYVPRAFDGIPVRDGALRAVINHGNLVLLGLSRWAPRPRAGAFARDAGAARRRVTAYLQGRALEGPPPWLEYVPLANERAKGYGFQLVWVVTGRLAGDDATWEALVSASSGEL